MQLLRDVSLGESGIPKLHLYGAVGEFRLARLVYLKTI